MPGTNAGTGQPISFMCRVARRELAGERGDDAFSLYIRHEIQARHRESRTGRERPRPGEGGIRMMSKSVEYTCICGHTGWTRHYEVMRRPLKADP